jgi:hypothetical protein
MQINRSRILVGALACALSGLATIPATAQTAPVTAAPAFQANILIVDSHQAIAQWATNPKAGDAGRMRTVTVGQKIYVPVVVTGLKTTDIGPQGIVADFQFVAPGGKVLQDAKNCCRAANQLDPRTPGLIVLNPVLDMESEPGDPLGTYELRATVTYRGQTASASEKFVLRPGAGAKPMAASPTASVTAKVKTTAVPKAAPPKADPPGGPSRSNDDARKCLDATDNAGVARCAEAYR